MACCFTYLRSTNSQSTNSCCLIAFERSTKHPADCLEKAANFCLMPLRLSSGKWVKISYIPQKKYEEKETISKICRLFWGVIAAVFLPFTVVGCFFANWSKSYSSSHRDFILSFLKLPPKKELILQKSEKAPTIEVMPVAAKEKEASLFDRFVGWIQEKIKRELPQEFIIDCFKEAESLAEVGSLSAYLFSEENEKRILARLDLLDKMALECKTPLELSEKIPERAIENALLELEEHIELAMERPFRTACDHLAAISSLRDWLRKGINAKALRELRSTLVQEVGAGLAKEILSDWNYIGKDIRENTAVLSSVRMEKILEFARRAKDGAVPLEEIFVQLKQDLARDLLPQQTFVFKRYPNLQELLASMPACKTAILHQMMGDALVKKELANPAAFIGDIREAELIGALGFSLEKYEEKGKVREILLELLNPLLEESKEAPVDQLKRQIEEMAQKTRLKVAGVPEDQIPAVQELIPLYVEARREWNQAASLLAEKLPEEIKLKLSREWLIQEIAYRNRSLVKSLLRNLLKGNKDELLLSSSEERRALWVEKIFTEKNQKRLVGRCTNLEKFKKEIAWFAKYQNEFLYEFSQGYGDANDALQDGVCFALVIRLACMTLFSPDLPPSELKIDGIRPSDRRIQAHATFSMLQEKKGFCVPYAARVKEGVEEMVVFATKGKENIVSAIASNIDKLRSSNGGLMLRRNQHRTFLCIDEKNNRFFFFDPNFGMIGFRKEEGEKVEDLAVRMAICYNELYEWAYPEGDNLIANCLVPLNGKKPAPFIREQNWPGSAI